QLLIARSEGNPFFLEESVHTLVETGVLIGAPGTYQLGKPLNRLQVPATVQAVLAARIDRLSPEEKRLLQTAAVIGTDVPLPLRGCLGVLRRFPVSERIRKTASFLREESQLGRRKRFATPNTHRICAIVSLEDDPMTAWTGNRPDPSEF